MYKVIYKCKCGGLVVRPDTKHVSKNLRSTPLKKQCLKCLKVHK